MCISIAWYSRFESWYQKWKSGIMPFNRILTYAMLNLIAFADTFSTVVPNDPLGGMD